MDVRYTSGCSALWRFLCKQTKVMFTFSVFLLKCIVCILQRCIERTSCLFSSCRDAPSSGVLWDYLGQCVPSPWGCTCMTNKKGDRSKKNSAVALVEAGKLLGGTSRIYFASCVFLSNERPPESSLINNPPLDVMKRVYEKTQSAQNWLITANAIPVCRLLRRRIPDV